MSNITPSADSTASSHADQESIENDLAQAATAALPSVFTAYAANLHRGGRVPALRGCNSDYDDELAGWAGSLS